MFRLLNWSIVKAPFDNTPFSPVIQMDSKSFTYNPGSNLLIKKYKQLIHILMYYFEWWKLSSLGKHSPLHAVINFSAIPHIKKSNFFSLRPVFGQDHSVFWAIHKLFHLDKKLKVVLHPQIYFTAGMVFLHWCAGLFLHQTCFELWPKS